MSAPIVGLRRRSAPVRAEVLKALYILRLFAVREGERWPELLVRSGFLVVLLVVFGHVWRAAVGPSSPIASSDAIWYLACTECVLLALPFLHTDIEEDIAGGGLDTRLARPLGYLTGRWSEAAAAYAARFAALAVVASVTAWALTGRAPRPASGWWVFPVAAALAGACGVVWGSLVGLLAFRTRETTPAYWIHQKCCMVLGGLIVPLSICPPWMQDVAAWTPYAPMIGGVAGPALGASAATQVVVCARLVAWTAAGAVLARLLLRAGLRRHMEGGAS